MNIKLKLKLKVKQKIKTEATNSQSLITSFVSSKTIANKYD